MLSLGGVLAWGWVLGWTGADVSVKARGRPPLFLLLAVGSGYFTAYLLAGEGLAYFAIAGTAAGSMAFALWHEHLIRTKKESKT